MIKNLKKLNTQRVTVSGLHLVLLSAETSGHRRDPFNHQRHASFNFSRVDNLGGTDSAAVILVMPHIFCVHKASRSTTGIVLTCFAPIT